MNHPVFPPRSGLPARLIRRGLRSRAGMTLVEIMVVITIVVGLMAVLAVNVIPYLDDSKVSETRITMSRIEQALMQYYLKNKNKYPGTSDGLKAVADYLPNSEVPTDGWGNEFRYFSPGSHGDNPYEIISLGKDGKEGGAGADADIYSWVKE